MVVLVEPLRRVVAGDAEVVGQGLRGGRGRRQPDDAPLPVLGDPRRAQRAHRGGLAGAGRSDEQVDLATRRGDALERCALLRAESAARARPMTRATTAGAHGRRGRGFSARSSSRASASMTAVEEYFTECRGRKTLVPSSRWKRSRADRQLGRSERHRLPLGCVDDHGRRPPRGPRWWRSAGPSSASTPRPCRFQWFQIDRLTLTAATTSAPIASIAASGTSSTRERRAAGTEERRRPRGRRRRPSRSAARCRHSAVRSASDRISFGGRVASVAWARSSTIVFADGIRPCRATYSAMSSSFLISISRVRLENSAISSSLTPAISHCGLRSAPRWRSSHSTPRSRVSRSASRAL